MEKVDTMKEQIGNISREMETANENHKEMLEIKSNVTEMKTAFDGLISRPNMTEERIGDPEEVVLLKNFALKSHVNIHVPAFPWRFPHASHLLLYLLTFKDVNDATIVQF